MFAVYQIWVCKNPGDYRWQQKGNVFLYLVALHIIGKDGALHLQDICKCICKEMCNNMNLETVLVAHTILHTILTYQPSQFR